jgi:hypothetical protein
MKKIFWKLPYEHMHTSLLLYFGTGRKVKASCLLGANDYDSITLFYVVAEYFETTFDHIMVGLY